MSDGVYVLELMNGCYYVGKSSNIEKRIKLHKNCGGAVFVKKCGGIKRLLTPIIERIDNFNEWELKEALLRMHIHGVNNVRGFCYSQYKIYNKNLVCKIKNRIKSTLDSRVLEKYEEYSGSTILVKNVITQLIIQLYYDLN